MQVAFVFPGQGSQVVGMGKDFFENFKESQLVFEECADSTHLNLKKLCFDGPLDELTQTTNLQPALFTVELAILAALRVHQQLEPAISAGHSLGEYSALAAIGSLSVSDGARLTHARGQAMQKAVPLGKGTMAAILNLSEAQVARLCSEASTRAEVANPDSIVEPANFNAPGQIVIAGNTEAVDEAVSLVKKDPQFKGGRAISLQVSAPFHCKLMKPAQDEMAKALALTKFKKPSCPLIPNVTAHAISDVASFPGLLTSQIVQPVRWQQSMEKLKSLGIEVVLEIGPGKVLSSLQKRIDPSIPAKSISSVVQMKEIYA